MSTPTKKNEIFPVVILLIWLAWAVYQGNQYLEDHHVISHSKVATVIAANWSIGEIKTCDTTNALIAEDHPELDCENGHGQDVGKAFEVAFYGRTHLESEKQTTILVWDCKKEVGTDPSFTCHYDTLLPAP